jgi:tRNA1(Val) A37 N6-methylase TrmN6
MELFDEEIKEDENKDMVKPYFKTHKDKLQQISLNGDVVELQKTLIDRYLFPPFSVLDTRQGYWQKRRRAWLSLGIKSEIGRGENLLGFGGEVAKFGYTHNKDGTPKTKNSKYGKCLPSGFDKEKYGEKMSQATSIFDPTLCEVFYRWYCPDDGRILDPFAGGSVRGIVAHYLKYKYVGIELRPEQVEANKEQAGEIGVNPVWICDNSKNLDEHNLGEFDYLFSCPPYYDLEVYSNIPGELSNMPTYEEFLTDYEIIIQKATERLKNHRFATFIVANMRDKNGFYRNFIGDTVRLFQKNGMQFYNDAILVNTAGSLPIRINNQFRKNRKMGKMHQNILVFYKGDVDNIRNNFSEEV